MNIQVEVEAIQRVVSKRDGSNGEPVISVLARRSYPEPIERLWDALTVPDELKCWFLAVSGEMRVGGQFQTQGNAGGQILRCEAPHLLEITWGGETSLVQLRLSPDSSTPGGTTLELEHTVPLMFAQSGAGALFVGPGWDGALMALGGFLRGETRPDPSALETQRFNKQAMFAWGAAAEASGTASAEQVRAAVAAVTPQWSPEV
jgi:uncharacterized protein YndB with AHSA1/START domain